MRRAGQMPEGDITSVAEPAPPASEANGKFRNGVAAVAAHPTTLDLPSLLSKLEEQMEHCYGICASGDANADAISGLQEAAATDCREEVIEELRGRLVRFCHLVGAGSEFVDCNLRLRACWVRVCRV